jgi:glycosyl-4,4'-diaponeurosporenoate acyltransferase
VLIELPIGWIIVLNVAGWAVIQLGLAWAFTRMPVGWFRSPSPRTWERCGRFYEQVFAIKHWKNSLPDGASWFAEGFAKGALAGKDHAYMQRFMRETWRGECCHWCALACAPVFFLWNPWWSDVVIVAYALAANFPCIIVQRYNRARLHRALGRHLRND